MKFKKIFKSPFLWAFLIGIASLHLIKELALKRRSAPEPLVHVSDWQLNDQHGRPFGKKDLQGRVVIADFFFTSCPTICPRLTEAMKEVYERLKDKDNLVSFVSFSVDPERDTPEVLREFMNKYGLTYPNWHSLTGRKEDMYHIVVDNMRLHVGEREAIEGSQTYDIPHLAHLVLFDQNGDLRGLFKTEPVEMAALVRAANFLLEKN